MELIHAGIAAGIAFVAFYVKSIDARLKRLESHSDDEEKHLAPIEHEQLKRMITRK